MSIVSFYSHTISNVFFIHSGKFSIYLVTRKLVAELRLLETLRTWVPWIIASFVLHHWLFILIYFTLFFSSWNIFIPFSSQARSHMETSLQSKEWPDLSWGRCTVSSSPPGKLGLSSREYWDPLYCIARSWSCSVKSTHVEGRRIDNF